MAFKTTSIVFNRGTYLKLKFLQEHHTFKYKVPISQSQIIRNLIEEKYERMKDEVDSESIEGMKNDKNREINQL